MKFSCVQNQSSESSGNGKTTLEKGGRDPPNKSLIEVADDLLSYIGGSPHLNKTEKEIEKKYDIKKEHDGSWPEDDIKRAWGKTQRLDETSLKRKRWALAIILQVMKRSSVFEGFKRKAAQTDQKKAGDSIQSCAEESMGNTSDQIQSGQNTAGSKGSASTYIRIPLSDMFRNESVEGRKEKGSTTHKLIDRLPNCPEIKKRKSYVMLYNNQTRNATWVYEILNKSTLAAGNKNKELNKNIRYEDDISSLLYQKVKSIENFEESDYNHGHLAAAANHRWCKEAHKDTYYLSNIAPQTYYLNKEMEKLEDQWRKKILNDNEKKIRNVHMYTGPLYVPDKKRKSETLKIWKTKVVPTHFFKVVIVENEDGTVEEPKCYRLPNVKPEEINSQSKDKSKQSKDKNNKSKDESKQSKDINNENDTDRYIVEIQVIECESMLRFTERGCIEGERDSTRTVKWKGGDGNGEPPCAKINVRISTPHSDYNDFVYI